MQARVDWVQIIFGTFRKLSISYDYGFIIALSIVLLINGLLLALTCRSIQNFLHLAKNESRSLKFYRFPFFITSLDPNASLEKFI